MRIKFLDLNKQYLSIKKEIDDSILSEINKCEYINGSAKTLFETKFADYIGTKYCLGVANGTDALEIAINTLNLPEDSEVLVQTNTFIATCLGITYNRLKIIFVDIDPDTLMIDLNMVESLITSKTRLIVPVHLYGQSCDMDRLMNICIKNNIYMIEDCAQSHGALYNNRKLGTYGHMACFSFYPGKNLGAYGDGGAICTNNIDYFNQMKKFAGLGSTIKYKHELIGRNSRLDTIQASVLTIKLKYLDGWNRSRRQKSEIYKTLLKDINAIKIIETEKLCEPVYHLFIIRVSKLKNELVKYLEDKGIEILIHYPILVHKSQAYLKYNDESYPVAEQIVSEIVSLPMYAEIEIAEIEYICDSIKLFFINI